MTANVPCSLLRRTILVIFFATIAAIAFGPAFPSRAQKVTVIEGPEDPCIGGDTFFNRHGIQLYCVRPVPKKKRPLLIRLIEDVIHVRVTSEQCIDFLDPAAEPSREPLRCTPDDIRKIGNWVNELCGDNFCKGVKFSKFPPNVRTDDIKSMFEFLQVAAVRSFSDQTSPGITNEQYAVRLVQMQRAVAILNKAEFSRDTNDVPIRRIAFR